MEKKKLKLSISGSSKKTISSIEKAKTKSKNTVVIQKKSTRFVGGKPSFSYIENMPAFVPIMFELTVFFAAHLMVITFYMRSKLWPFKKSENPNPLTTDDKFLMEIIIGNKEKELVKLVKSTGAIEVTKIEKNE